MEAAKVNRQQKKRSLTTRINAMQRYIAEECEIDHLKDKREQLKAAFADLEQCHQTYEENLDEDKDLEDSEKYFNDVQNSYIACLKEVNQYIDKKQVTNPKVSEVSTTNTEIQYAAINLPKLEIEVFTGDPMRYHAFISTFEESVEKYCSDGGARLTRLLQYTDGKAKKAIRACAVTGGTEGYKKAREILQQRFGDKLIVSESIISNLRHGKSVYKGHDVQDLADDLQSCVITLKQTGQLSEIDTQKTIIDIISRLPRHIQNRWRKEAIEIRRDEGLYPNIEHLVQFVSEVADEVNDPVYGQHEETAKKSKYQSASQQNHATFVTSRYSCPLCDQQHGVWACEKFKNISPTERWSVAKEHRLCFRCLGSGHGGKRCRRARICGIDNCPANHNRLLHEHKVQSEQNSTQVKTPSQSDRKQSESSNTYVTKTENSQSFLSLRTVPVYLSNGNKTVKVNALLDEASTRTYVNEDIAAELGLSGELQIMTVNVLDDNQQTLNTMNVEFNLSSLDHRVQRRVSAQTAKRVTGNLQSIDWNAQKWKWNHLRGINFPQLGPKPTVDILIGIDNSDLLYSIKEVIGHPGEPIARLTPLGWTCVGGSYSTSKQNITNFTFLSKDEDNISTMIQRYWDLDDPHYRPIMSAENESAKAMASESLSYNGDRYKIGLPWKENRQELCENRDMAVSRLQNTEKRLEKCKELSEAYNATLQKYIDKEYIRKVPSEEKLPDQTWFLPHFPILRPDKSTTKLRIVFDASARSNNISLNDVIHQGPKLQNDLTSILIRFRHRPVAVMCDIQEMYLQICLNEEDRPYHRFLWRNLDREKSPEIYEFSRLVFGVNCSPFLAQFVTQQHAKKFEKQFPLGAETILKSTYMDDSMDSVPDVQTAIRLYSELTSLWKSAGMHARKWLSNSPEVLKDIPSADWSKDVDLDKGGLPTVKTLGIMWSPSEDQFRFQVTLPPENSHKTKRGFLKKIAALFDPLGFLTPYTITAKILLQDMWSRGLDWDEVLDKELSDRAYSWFQDLTNLSELRIPRCITSRPDVQCITLHVFVDASQEAYGAVAYARTVYQDNSVSCRLISSKSHVAPLQAISIPRLELTAAVSGVRLAKSVAKAQEIDNKNWVFWSDSMNALYWIQNRSRNFKPFVANRVAEIQQNSGTAQWRYVPTKENPADHLSRGLDMQKLICTDSWWQGPTFLKRDPQYWPENKVVRAGPETENRKKTERASVFHTDMTDTRTHLIDPRKYSDWNKLSKVTARVFRFIDNCQLPTSLRCDGALKPDEIVSAEMSLIRQAQEEAFPKEYKALESKHELLSNSKLRSLNPIMDEDGILRCDGRLQHAQYIPWETKYPIILPRDHQITQLIVKNSHERNKHSGTNQVLADLSTRYWILAAREAIRNYEHNCVVCKRNKSRPVQPIMAPLHELRLRNSMKAFAQTAIDFAGPFITKQGRGKVRQKRYLCLFTCLTSRAVHLEVAYSLSTDSFLNAFFRMTSRRGVPTDIVTDNGLNFVGANNELKELNNLQKQQIQDKTVTYGVKWHFNPPEAPHFSGAHEVMIRAAKRAINKILGNAEITDEELLTAVVGAEGLINSRPLTYQSSNPNDPVPLTPNHFLFGQMGGKFAPEIVDSSQFDIRKRWRRVQELMRHFWQRWIKEWLPSLNSRKKWNSSNINHKEGDVVLVLSPDTPRGKWPLGRIVKTYPGPDGVVRVVDVKIGKNTFKRPVVKLCPIEQCMDMKT